MCKLIRCFNTMRNSFEHSSIICIQTGQINLMAYKFHFQATIVTLANPHMSRNSQVCDILKYSLIIQLISPSQSRIILCAPCSHTRIMFVHTSIASTCNSPVDFYLEIRTMFFLFLRSIWQIIFLRSDISLLKIVNRNIIHFNKSFFC